MLPSRKSRQPAREWGRRLLAAATALTMAALVGLPLFGGLPAAYANGVPLAQGDVLAAIGNGQVENFSPTGTLQDTLDTSTGATYTTGMCFLSSGDVLVTDFDSSEISEFNPAGNLVTSTWATVPTTAESCTVDAKNNVYVGGPGSPDIYEFNSSGTLTNTFAVTGGSGTGGTDWVDLASDQCTILYTGEGTQILSYNVCTQTQNPDFADGLPGPCYELRIRPNGDVMVACESEIVRLDSSGKVVQTYTVPSSSQLFAMNLDPDNQTFWTGDIGNGEVSHLNITTGAVITQFNSNPATQLAGLAVVGQIVVSQPTVTLSPPTATKPVNTSDTVTATITDPGGSINGQTVDFSVTGANTASGSGVTNASGQTTFKYTGKHTGTDTVTATYKTATGTATVKWITGTGPNCTLTSVTNGPPSQLQFTVQDSTGLASVSSPVHANSAVKISGFTAGTTKPVTGTFTKKVEAAGGSGSVSATNESGQNTFCLGQYKTVGYRKAYTQGFVFYSVRNHLVIQNPKTGGLGSIVITLNGGTPKKVSLTPGETYQETLTNLEPGSKNNHMVVRGFGPSGATAVVTVWGLGNVTS